jgi:signal transduction histidine kinase
MFSHVGYRVDHLSLPTVYKVSLTLTHVGRDITDKKELEMEYHEQELMKFSTSLATANKKLTLLSSISWHDINNQLTILRGYLELLEDTPLVPSQIEYFQKISTAAQRITSMIRFMKEYEAIGVHAPVWQDTRTLLATVAKQAPLGTVVVKSVVPAGAEVFADPLIVKIFYHLMDNAVRYGGKITTICFFFEERDDNYLILCEDDGDGIIAEKKEKIFERGFVKEHRAWSGTFAGDPCNHRHHHPRDRRAGQRSTVRDCGAERDVACYRE